MPLYDYGCHKCGYIVEKFHKMAESPEFYCPDCHDIPLEKLMSTGFFKRPDATWIKDVNGFGLNDLEYVHQGRQEYIETREQARKAINRVYSDPHPNVQKLRKRYLERF
jgi:putative FmdB family regulatory protein